MEGLLDNESIVQLDVLLDLTLSVVCQVGDACAAADGDLLQRVEDLVRSDSRLVAVSNEPCLSG